MANRKTITATTTESYVEFPATYQFMWFMNYGENDCYISDHSGIVAGADDVILLKAGEARRLGLPQCPAVSKAYIKAADGSNTVEVHAQNFSDCPFKKKAKGGEQITVESLTATENKIYTAPTGKAYSPVTVNVPNTYSASDEGKVVSSGTLVLQTSATKTQNGTYNTTTNNEIIVNVTPPCELMSRTDWNTLTTAQKQAKGLVAIQDADSGYLRGQLVNGADYHDTLLMYSTYANILEDDKASGHESGTSTWGGLTLSGNMDNDADGAIITDGKIVSFDLSGANTPITIYALMKRHGNTESGNRTMIGVPYAMSGYNLPNIFCNGSTVYTSVYGSDDSISGISSTNYALYTMAIDAVSKKVDFYVNGVLKRSGVGFSNSGGHIVFGAAETDLTNVISCNIKYIGIVDGYEHENVIMNNHIVIMNEYGL